MQLVRLELINISPAIAVFDNVFEALCKASSQLSRLRSLSLNIPTRNPWVLDAISQSFPQLTHLTLSMWFTTTRHVLPRKASGPRRTGVLLLDYLEVLILHTDPGCFDLTHWMFPKLHTVRVTPLSGHWDTNIFPFLRNHSSKIEVIDLDGSYMKQMPVQLEADEFSLPIGFWEVFSHLRMLSIKPFNTQFLELPNKGHTLTWLVYIDPINSADSWLAALSTWAMNHEGGNPREIILNGGYIDKVCKDDVGGAVGVVLQGLERNDIKIVRRPSKGL